MNIEDSIKTLKEFNKIKINSYAMQFVNISYPDLQEAIETLLTAYEKEKEKNKELTDEYLVQRDLINPDFLKDYIHKDKIKAKIEEVKDGTYDAKIVLQSLLEKE